MKKCFLLLFGCYNRVLLINTEEFHQWIIPNQPTKLVCSLYNRVFVITIVIILKFDCILIPLNSCFRSLFDYFEIFVYVILKPIFVVN